MIHLFYADRLESLVVPLADSLRERDPFRSVTIVVPNRNLKRWLELNLSRLLGITANVRFSFLDPLLVDHFYGNACRLLPDQVQVTMLAKHLYAARESSDPKYSSLKRYLSDGPDLDIRVLQTAHHLVGLFREYAFHRPDMLRAWKEDRLFLKPFRNMEAWQKALWLAAFGKGGDLQLLNERRPDARHVVFGMDLPEPRTFDPVYIFGVSYVSPYHQILFDRLAQKGLLHLFVLNPCREFWEDVVSKKEKKKGGDGASFFEDNPFLEAWGRPGREYFKRLNLLSNYDPRDVFSPEYDPRGLNLLNRVRQSILTRQVGGFGPPAKTVDDSITVLRCPSPRREAEIVANEIWRLMRGDPNLALGDIAVLVTQMSDYQGDIENAFQRIHQLPYNLVDGTTGRASKLLEGIRLLLDLAETAYERTPVFRLLRHPNFRARYPEADPELWLSWAERYSIFFGADRDQQVAAGDAYFKQDLFNWQQAFRRLFLGEYLEVDQVLRIQTQSATYTLESGLSGKSEQAALFHALCRSLIADMEHLSRGTMSAERWARFLTALLETYLAPRDGEVADYEAMLGVTRELSSLADAYEDPDTPLTFTHIRFLLEKRLESITSHHGRYLADGITVSSLLPMRPIPFKVLFIMGLDESRFPAVNRRDPLDLRRFHLGDGSDISVNERDRYMFLESLMSARERLILSYVDRDICSDDPVNPASVLAELLQWSAAFGRPLEKRHPLKSYSAEYSYDHQNLVDACFDPAARSMYAAALVRARAADSNALLDELGIRGKRAFDLVALPRFGETEPERVEERSREISLGALNRFLRCPLQASGTYLLGLKDDDDGEQSHEPFALGIFEEIRVLNRVLDEGLGRTRAGEPPDFTPVLEREAESDAGLGRFPAGSLSEPCRLGLQQTLDGWRSQLEALGIKGPCRSYRLVYRGYGRDDVLEVPDLTAIKGDQSTKIRLTGQTQFHHKGARLTQALVFIRKGDKDKFAVGALKGYLDGLLLYMLGYQGEFQTVVIAPDKSKTYVLSLNAEQAGALLLDLVQEFLGQVHEYLLPIEAVLHAAESLQAEDLAGAQEQMAVFVGERLKRDFSGLSSAYGPVDDWTFYPFPENGAVFARRRFAPFLSMLEAGT